MSAGRVLIGGVGNIFLGDDAFGSEVARRLRQRPQPEGVRVIDFGIRGLDLAYALLDGYDAVVLMDAARRGGTPGTLYLLEPNEAGSEAPPDGHGVSIDGALRLAASLGSAPGRVLVVGCEPESCEEGIGLGVAVEAAVGEAVALVESLAAKLLAEQ